MKQIPNPFLPSRPNFSWGWNPNLVPTPPQQLKPFKDLTASPQVIKACYQYFTGIFGKGNCGCPCRDYYIPKCETTYVQKCYQEHYEEVIFFKKSFLLRIFFLNNLKVCHEVPIYVTKKAKETECQVCIKKLIAVFNNQKFCFRNVADFTKLFQLPNGQNNVIQ